MAVACWKYPDSALECGAIAVLAVRPTLDAFSVRNTSIGIWTLSPAALFGLAALLTGAVLAVRRLSSGKPLWPDLELRRVHLWFFAAYGIGVASGIYWYGSSGLSNGVRELIRVSSIIAAFLILLWWREGGSGREARGWAYLLVGTIPVVAIALWQMVYGPLEPELGLRRIQGTLTDPNSFGVYLVPFTVYAVAQATAVGGMQRLLRLAIAVGLAVLIVLTYSRTALLVLVAGLLVLPVLQFRRLNWPAIRRGVLVAAVVLAVGWALGGEIVQSRFSGVSFTREALERAQTGTSENSLEWRLINWGILITMGREHVWTGHGAGMTTVLNPLISIANNLPFNAHDDYVRFFFEAGLIGLACYLAYALLLCRWALHQARNSEPGHAAARYAVAAALLAIYFLSFGTPEISLNTVILYELYGMLALLLTQRAVAPSLKPAPA